MASDGYRRGYVSFAHFLLYLNLYIVDAWLYSVVEPLIVRAISANYIELQ